jgi:hypothetical protein
MKETLDQHAAHSPPLPPSGWRHAAHSGGNAVSSTSPKAARPNWAKGAKGAKRAMRRGVSDGVADMASRVAAVGPMCQWREPGLRGSAATRGYGQCREAMANAREAIKLVIEDRLLVESRSRPTWNRRSNGLRLPRERSAAVARR